MGCWVAGMEASKGKLLFMSTDQPVEAIIHPHILECSPEESLREVARRMSERRCSSILVVEDGQPVGIWTERDALRLDYASGDTGRRPVGEVMTSPVKTIPGSTPANEVAVHFQEDQVRHYLVVDSAGRPQGVVSQTDVVLNQSIEHYLHLREVGSVMRQHPPRVSNDASLSEAVTTLREYGADAVVVGDDAEPGILTERDLVRALASETTMGTAGELASRPLLAAPVEQSLFHVRNLMVEEAVRHVGVTDEGGKITGLVGFTDILSSVEFVYVRELKSALRERDQALQTSRKNLRMAERIIEASPDGVIITDSETRIQSVNPAFTRLTGYQPEEAIGQTPAMLSSGRHGPEFYREMWRELRERGHWQGEIWNRRKNGEIYPELLTITGIADDEGVTTHYAAMFSDISRSKDNEERIRRLAYYDALTGLPNRRLFDDRLQVALAQAHRYDHQLALLYVDLDRFKRVNDTLGHAVGDALLLQVADVMRAELREGDSLARLGGDEFVVLLPELDDSREAVNVARRLVDRLGEPFDVDGHELFVTSSVGISLYPLDGDDGETLSRAADNAMYRAKELGRNTYQLYTPEMNAHTFQSLTLENHLRRALEREQFECYYQPLVDVQSGALVSAEVLLRWHHPDMGLVSPADFIPLAEETGLVVPIGDWVLHHVCQQLRHWLEAGKGLVPVGVNISALQFGRDHPLAPLEAALDDSGIDPGLLALELTEGVLMQDTERSVERLRRIRDMGLGVAVDDFGTGYSSLAYLRRFPITALKVDQSFVKGIAEDPEDAAIVSTVVSLGRSLGLKVVAEGVETPEQLAFLQEEGCHVAQGFHFGYPQTAEAFARNWLTP